MKTDKNNKKILIFDYIIIIVSYVEAFNEFVIVASMYSVWACGQKNHLRGTDGT